MIGSTSDRMLVKHAKRHNGVVVPEVRLRVCVYYSFLVPISFVWYGWASHQHAFWLAPTTGLVCFGLGMIGIFLPIQTYMIDAFPEYAASSTAALASSRNVVGTFLPLAGPFLCKSSYISQNKELHTDFRTLQTKLWVLDGEILCSLLLLWPLSLHRISLPSMGKVCD